MEVLKREIKLCLICMEEHEVLTVKVFDEEIFKEVDVQFQSIYEYCGKTDEYLENEDMIPANSLAMKDAYRESVGLLTSKEIMEIREQYQVSQKDFAKILGWGLATITRYENHQVQDKVHDDVLRKMKSDPKWFIEMLQRARDSMSVKAYDKYLNIANAKLGEMGNYYLSSSIYACYANFKNESITGNTLLNLDKVIEMINYYASKVESLHKVKLMKMLWYGDALSYKNRGYSISGLVYRALPMGAVPECSELIIDLDEVNFTEVYYPSDHFGYKFNVVEGFEIKELTKEDLIILDKVVEEVGHLNTNDIITKMHAEDAYQETEEGGFILYPLAKTLSIS